MSVRKSTAKARLQNALEFLRDYQENMRRSAPIGEGDQWAAQCWWWPRQPAYSWSSYYGDFTPETLRAGVSRGLIVRKGDQHAYRISPDGRVASTPPDYEICTCGRLSHLKEAACVHCGRTKSWAQP